MLSLSRRQIKYLKSLPERVFIRDRPDSYNIPTVPLKQGTTWFFGKTIMSRLVLNSELVWDIDGKHRPIELNELWDKCISPVGLKLRSYFDDNGLKAYYFDSGQGLHVSVFAENLNPLTLSGKPRQRFRKLVWDEINRIVGFGESDMREIDEGPMRRTGESVIRACGAYNAKSKTYKTQIQDLSRKMLCRNPANVKFPNKIETSKIPDEILKTAITKYKELGKKRRTPHPIRMGSASLSLPCIKNLLSKPIPPTGMNIRSKLAAIVAYNALRGTCGDENEASDIISRFVENCREIDPSYPSQKGWIKYIMAEGLGNWQTRCSTVKRYEKALKELGNEIVICEPNKCQIALMKRRKRLKMLW